MRLAATRLQLEGDAMDNEDRRIRQHLAEAERHVSHGERLVEHQRMTIEERRRDGHDIELPTQVLTQLEEALRLHIEGRDRLRRELAEADPLFEKQTPSRGTPERRLRN
jgi:hypothetical protein